jgi:hypothetical protein
MPSLPAVSWFAGAPPENPPDPAPLEPVPPEAPPSEPLPLGPVPGVGDGGAVMESVGAGAADDGGTVVGAPSTGAVVTGGVGVGGTVVAGGWVGRPPVAPVVAGHPSLVGDVEMNGVTDATDTGLELVAVADGLALGPPADPPEPVEGAAQGTWLSAGTPGVPEAEPARWAPDEPDGPTRWLPFATAVAVLR